MNEYQDRLKDISEIRNMMERSSKFLSLSGLSGISAGIVALIGAGVAWYFMGAKWDYTRTVWPSLRMDIETFFLLDAGIVLLLALLSAIFFSQRKARKENLPMWNKTTQYVVISMAIPLIAGGLFCFIQAHQGIYRWISATTLLFYGMALLNASKYTLREIRLLGISQMILGLICASLPGYGLYFWALGFGVLHIIYGIVMYLRYDR